MSLPAFAGRGRILKLNAGVSVIKDIFNLSTVQYCHFMATFMIVFNWSFAKLYCWGDELGRILLQEALGLSSISYNKRYYEICVYALLVIKRCVH